MKYYAIEPVTVDGVDYDYGEELPLPVERVYSAWVRRGRVLAVPDDVGGGGGVQSGAMVRLTADIEHGSTGTKTLPFDNVIYDTDGYHDPGDPTKLTVQEDGMYLVGGYVRRQASRSSGGERILVRNAADNAWWSPVSWNMREYPNDFSTEWSWGHSGGDQPYQLLAGAYARLDVNLTYVFSGYPEIRKETSLWIVRVA